MEDYWDAYFPLQYILFPTSENYFQLIFESSYLLKKKIDVCVLCMIAYVEVIIWKNLISTIQASENLELAWLELSTAYMKGEV